MAPKFSILQQKILNVLANGKPHPRQELLDQMDDPLATFRNLNDHIYRLRKKLRPNGHDVICENVHRRICYRHVILIGGEED